MRIIRCFLSLLMLLSLLTACDEEDGIFGNDSRKDPICYSEYIARRALTVAIFYPSGGTGFLISPENHVLTTAHAIPEDSPFWSNKGKFCFYHIAEACGGSLSDEICVPVWPEDLIKINRKLDYALFKLPYNKIGDEPRDWDIAMNLGRYGWLALDPSTRLTQLSPEETGLFVFGNDPDDLRIQFSTDDDCRILKPKSDCKPIEDNGFDAPDNACFEHKCDTVKGFSGGPTLLKKSSSVLGLLSGVGGPAYSVKTRRIYSEIREFLPDMRDTDGDGMPDVRDNCPDVRNTGWCREGSFAMNCISDRDCDTSFAAHDGRCVRSQTDMNGNGTGDACEMPDNPTLTSATHTKGQPSCEQVLTVEWETPHAPLGVGGYSYVIVSQDDHYYDNNRTPDNTIEIDASVSNFTTQPLESGHTWEFNIRTIDSTGLNADFYSSFWVKIESCSVDIWVIPREGAVFQVGDWVNFYWSQVTYDGIDVGGCYDVRLDLMKGPSVEMNVGANIPNVLGYGFTVPNAEPGTDYTVRIILERMPRCDQYTYLPERFAGFANNFSISGP